MVGDFSKEERIEWAKLPITQEVIEQIRLRLDYLQRNGWTQTGEALLEAKGRVLEAQNLYDLLTINIREA